jgi:hypothetical protein
MDAEKDNINKANEKIKEEQEEQQKEQDVNTSIFGWVFFFIIALNVYLQYSQLIKPYIIRILTYFLLIGIQSAMSSTVLRTRCGNINNMTAYIFMTFIPWIVIFLPVEMFLLNKFPAWKTPFSNTFGYLTTKLLGVRTVLTSILDKTNTSDEILKNIYKDPSLFINEITEDNFDNMVKIMFPMLQKDEDLEKLLRFIKIKDYVAVFVWYWLISNLIVHMNKHYLSGIPCDIQPI